MQILFEDKDILVVVKPAGVATESANIRNRDIVSEARAHLGNQNSFLGLVHRLDQPVSGILVLAKTQKAAANLSRQVQTDDMKKYYRAVVEGRLDSQSPASLQEILLTNYLVKDSKQSKAFIVNKGSKGPDGKIAKEASLSYQILSYDESADTSTLRIHLHTGRFHQIRAQLSHLGHPILGDLKYGSKKPAADSATGISLCAYELSFLHPVTSKRLDFIIPD